MADYNIPYNIGDTVSFYLNEDVIGVICPCCEGDKYIIGKDKKQYTCPKCKGSGYDKITEMGITAEGTVLEINFTDLSADNNDEKIIYKVKYGDNKVKYINDKDIIISEEEVSGEEENN